MFRIRIFKDDNDEKQIQELGYVISGKLDTETITKLISFNNNLKKSDLFSYVCNYGINSYKLKLRRILPKLQQQKLIDKYYKDIDIPKSLSGKIYEKYKQLMIN